MKTDKHDGWLYLDNSGFLASLGVYLQMFFEFSPKSTVLARGGSSKCQKIQNSSFTGGFARRFRQRGWSYVDNSGFLSSLGVYLQVIFYIFFEKVDFLPVAGP